MEFRIFVIDIEDYAGAGIDVFNYRGLEWFVDVSYGVLPLHIGDPGRQFTGCYLIKKWCETFCKENVGCRIGGVFDLPTYYFASEEDATLFKLTWG